MNNSKTVQKLQAQIKHLKKQNQQFRYLTHELIEAFYRSVNKNLQDRKETSSAWTSNPNWEQLFKTLINLKNSQKTNQTNCSFTFDNLKDIYEQMNKENNRE